MRIRDPLRAARELVRDATEADLETIESVELFLARSNDAPVHLAWVPLAGGEGEAAVIALGAAHELMGVAVVDGSLERVSGWGMFMRLFPYADVPRLDGARPRSWLEERRRRAVAAPEDGESQIVLALLDLQRCMNEQASVFNLPEEGRTRTPSEELEMIAEQYRLVAELAPRLRPLFGDVVDEVETLALDSAAGTEAMKVALGEGDQAEINRLRKRVVANCRDCHFMPGETYEGRLAGASRAAREERGIGNGFYQVGHDLRIGHRDRAAAQRVADAMRLGALMIDAN